MPHIRVSGLPEMAVATLSNNLLEALADICQAKADSFILDSIQSSNYRHGIKANDIAQVEVLWFPKDPETHHRAEKAIREAILAAYPIAKHVIVMFRQLEPSTYYKDGQHY
ncbi:hypothetical protein TUM4438_36810 [Shewanella sairae]|uniref:DUF1904 domain-containing protein n=1 Tax=Shewanella sairae TaxID=190310 RepID=A0ABQ4PPA5_9GAMM|nr:DUF1904 family protein [Shewanella sairae]MCL1130596.1 DUF1904 domain-containing protein [Shewanella sairae]GIU50522.1 hypothetical protein TUM4438_36810 [Shewanella sairae]